MAGDLMKGDLVRHPQHGIGRVDDSHGYGETQKCWVFFARGDRTASVPRAELELLPEGGSEAYELVRLALRELRVEEEPSTELGDRWKGGELILKPQDPAMTPKTIPLETFFHKIVMIRDRLRVLEAQINSRKTISDAEKVDLQQYVTRCYGSLTTFNLLFMDKTDWFVGQKGEG